MKQGRLINFELLWDTDLSVNVVLPKLLELEFQEAVADGVTTIFGMFLMEGIYPHDCHNQQLFLEIKKIADKYNLEVILLSGLGESFNNQYSIENGSILNNLPFEVIYSSYPLRVCYNIINNIPRKPKTINNKFLFLGGIPTRLNRIYLLSKLYENNLLINGKWSFFIPLSQEDKNYCRNLLSHYSDEEYETFLKNCTSSIDEKYQEMANFFQDYAPYEEGDLEKWGEIVHTDFWKNPIYIDPEVYDETSLSIISEGPNYWSPDYKFITEKTWRTIIYKHPFIFAGPPEQFRYIKQMGFETFEKYMLIQNYAQVEDEKERIELIVKNVEHFLKHQTYHQKEIQQDIEHNFNLFLKLANDQNCLLTSLKSKYNIPDAEFSKFFSASGYENLIRPVDDLKKLG